MNSTSIDGHDLDQVGIVKERLHFSDIFKLIEAIFARVNEIVPASRAKVQNNDDTPKYLRLNMESACAVLTNRLKNIISEGRPTELVSMRQHIQAYSKKYAKELQMANPHDIHSLTSLAENLEKSDIGTLLARALPRVRAEIEKCDYLPREHHMNVCKPDDVWKWIENELLAMKTLAWERWISVDELGQLLLIYYKKYVDGMLLRVEQFEVNPLDEGNQMAWRIVFHSWETPRADPEMDLIRLTFTMTANLGETEWMALNEKIQKHRKERPMRIAKSAFKKLSENWLHRYNLDLANLAEASKQHPRVPQEVLSQHACIISIVSDCLPLLRAIVTKLIEVRKELEWLDLQFLEELEEIMMKMHLENFKSAKALSADQEFQQFMRWGLGERLHAMQSDITASKDNKRASIWSVWLGNLKAQIPGNTLSTGGNSWRRPAPGGASGRSRR